MSSTRFYKDQTFSHNITDSSAYGTYGKFIMEKIVQMSDGMFGAPEVITDNTNEYNAYSPIWGTDMRLRVMTNSSYFYLYICQKIGETYKTISNTSVSISQAFNVTSTSFRIMISNMNDCVGGIQIDHYSAAIAYGFGYLYSEKQGKNIYVSSYGNTYSSGGISIPFSASNVLQWSISKNALNSAGSSVGITTYGVYSDYVLSIMRASNQTYCLIPTCYFGYLNNSPADTCDLGRFKWGGLYDAYTLYTATGAYSSADPAANYIVDGTTYPACFSLFAILKEAA